MARNRRGIPEISTGITMMAVFGGLWLFLGHGPWFFLLLFAGFLPFMRGMLHLLGKGMSGDDDRQELDRDDEDRYSLPRKATKVDLEKEALRMAKQEGGRLTPASATLGMSGTLEETEKILEGLAGRGYARMEVTDDGRVEYVFPEFLPKSDSF